MSSFFIVKANELDSSYYSPTMYHPKYRELEKLIKQPTLSILIRNQEIVTGKSIANTSKSEEIGYLKVANVKPYKPLYSKMTFTDKDTVTQQSLPMLEPNDVIISRVGTVGKVCLFYGNPFPCTISDNVLKLTPEKIDARYLVAFLNSRLGLLQIERVIKGALQGVINTSTLGAMKIPISTDPEIMSKIGKNFFEAYEESIKLESEASLLEKTLTDITLRKTGILTPPLQNVSTYIAPSDSLSDRLDPKFYHPNNVKLTEDILKTCKTKLTDLSDFPERPIGKTDPEQSFNYIDIKSINRTFGTIDKTKVYQFKNAPQRAQQIIYENDILVSLTRPTRNAIAIVPHELNGQVCSSGFAILTAKNNVNPMFLLNLLRTEIVRLQMFYRTRGAMYPAILPSDLKDLVMPTPIEIAFNEEKQKPILLEIENMKNTLMAKRKQAYQVLHDAKVKVEKEIDVIL
jgi:restriction endonuclease S subunit